jgi:hypothetical protein
MSESKHTPGPWVVENPMGEDVGLWIVQDGLEAHQWSCIAIVTDDEDGSARDEGGRFIGRNEQRANARLIAAAPEMLEALHLAGMSAGWQYMTAETRAVIEAAIAKAEGRS